jgi:uncharacterized membrane-anchored protein
MKQTLILTLFGVLALAQLATPAWMIADRELTLRQGESFKFRTAPVDPYDPFRGRYVALRLDPDSGVISASTEIDYDQRAYAVLERDDEGFARISEIRLDPPEDGACIRVKISGVSDATASVLWPVDRYYMDERLAPEAERAYFARSTERDERKAHVTVRVRSGKVVLEELYIEDVPIVEYVERKMAKE